MSSLKVPVETGEQLREWRRRVGCSQERLGQELGVSDRAVRSWELGEQELPRTVQLALRGLEGPLRRRVEAERQARRELARLERNARIEALRASRALERRVREVLERQRISATLGPR